MIMGQYGLRDPYCHVDYSKVGTMRSDDPWPGYCSPKSFQHTDGLFYIVQWRLNVSTGRFWYVIYRASNYFIMGWHGELVKDRSGNQWVLGSKLGRFLSFNSDH